MVVEVWITSSSSYDLFYRALSGCVYKNISIDDVQTLGVLGAGAYGRVKLVSAFLILT